MKKWIKIALILILIVFLIFGAVQLQNYFFGDRILERYRPLPILTPPKLYPDDPINVSPNFFDVKQGKFKDVRVRFYNPSDESYWRMLLFKDEERCGGLCNNNHPEFSCKGDFDCRENSSLYVVYNDRPFTLHKDGSVGWGIIVQPNKTFSDEKAILLTVQFCSVDKNINKNSTCYNSKEEDYCCNGKEYFQKELFFNIKEPCYHLLVVNLRKFYKSLFLS
jgi:hypothetical protein